MSQDEIDALLAGMSGEPAPASPPGPGLPPSTSQATTSPATTGKAAKKPAPPGPSAVDQVVLDELLNDLQSGGDSGSKPAVLPTPTVAPSANGDEAAVPSPAVEAPLGSDDIEALLASLSPTPPVRAATAAPRDEPEDPLGAATIDDLLRNLIEPVSAPVTPAKANPIGGMSKTGSASSASKLNAKPVALSAPGASRGNLALTSEDLTALVSKHAAVAPAGEPADGMIDQQDIDALVKQLGSVNGPGEEVGAKPTMTQELAKHDAAIDQLLSKHNPAVGGANAVTMDAIDMKSVLERSPSAANSARPGSSGPVFSGQAFNVPVLTPPELRGARWLLAVAVVLLGVCAGTLVVVASSLRTLGSELAHERQTALEPGEDYGDDFKAAVARISAPDEAEAAKGVLFLQRLKKRYPSHEAEIALVLARQARAHGAWQEAVREYASLPDDRLAEDPRVPLEYADTLSHVQQRDAARRQLYTLLANEARYLAPTTPARPADITQRNQRALIEAHLLLGRLLGRLPDTSEDTRTASAEPAHETTGETPPEHAAEGHAASHEAAEPLHEGHH